MSRRNIYLSGSLAALVFVVFALISEEKKKNASVSVKTVDVRVFFGYKDARPDRFVADRYEMAIFLQRVLGPCDSVREDCEFKQGDEGQQSKSDSQDQVLYKLIKTAKGMVKINLQVFASSAGADDNENRKNPFQKWRSEYIKDQFVEALKKADVVFYNGHSRAGGGPDFSVPELTNSKSVHYVKYQSKKPGFLLLQTALKQSPNSPLRLIGLYSCKSDQLFRKKIEAARPKLKVIGSRQLIYFSDALNDSLDELSQILKTI